jgi:hypothetical protein
MFEARKSQKDKEIIMKPWFALDPCQYLEVGSIGVSKFKDSNHKPLFVRLNGVSFHKDPKHKK